MQLPLIFDIKRFAVHDGPGIRTTFFLKGCPLHCGWCQNPESISPKPFLSYNSLLCINCGACNRVCPSLSPAHLIKQSDCTLCARCVAACPVNARSIVGSEMSADEILEAALADKIFYDSSGGGVTFSGGECMLYPEFLKEVLTKLRGSGIKTAIDTSGAVARANFEAIRGLADLYLFDIKKMDAAEHFRLTKGDNRRIFENLKALSSAGENIIIRLPLIPSLNDSAADIEAVAQFLCELPARPLRVELLPYNKLAESKYKNSTGYIDGSFGAFAFSPLTPQTNEYVAGLAKIFERHNLPVFAELL